MENNIKNKKIEEISVNYEYLIHDVKFANLNKNDTLDSYKHEIDKGDYYLETVQVKKLLLCSAKEFLKLGNNFLSNVDIYEKIGGSTVLDKDFKYFKHVDGKDFWEWDKVTQDLYKQKNVTVGVQVINKESGEMFIVNTEGYSYARYVGIFKGFDGDNK